MAQDTISVEEAYKILGSLVDKGLGSLPLVTLDNGDLGSFNYASDIRVGKLIADDYVEEIEDYAYKSEHNLQAYIDTDTESVVYIS